MSRAKMSLSRSADGIFCGGCGMRDFWLRLTISGERSRGE